MSIEIRKSEGHDLKRCVSRLCLYKNDWNHEPEVENEN